MLCTGVALAMPPPWRSDPTVRTRRLLLLGWFVSSCGYAGLYLATMAHNTLLAGEPLWPTLSLHPNLVVGLLPDGLEFVESSFARPPSRDWGIERPVIPPLQILYVDGVRIPLMYQYRQVSTIPILLVRESSRLLGQTAGVHTYIMLCAIIELGLLGAILFRVAGLGAACLGMAFWAFDVNLVCRYATIGVTESLLLAVVMAAVLCLLRVPSADRPARPLFAAGLLLGLGFYVKVAILWHAAALFVFVVGARWRGRILPFVAGGVVGMLPFLVLSDYYGVLGDMHRPEALVVPVRDLLTLLANRAEHFSVMQIGTLGPPHGLDVEAIRSLDVFGVSFLLLCAAPAVVMVLRRFPQRFPFAANFRSQLYGRLYIAFFVFVAFAWVSTLGREIPQVYLLDGFMLVAALLGIFGAEVSHLAKRRGAQVAVLVLLLAPTLGMTWRWAAQWREHDVVAAVSARSVSAVVSDLRARGDASPLTLRFEDIGLYEFLSDEEILPRHLAYLLEFRREDDMLALRSAGSSTLLVTLEQVLSHWAERVDPETYRKRMEAAGLRVTDERFYDHRGRPVVWWLRYEVMEDVPSR